MTGASEYRVSLLLFGIEFYLATQLHEILMPHIKVYTNEK